MLRGNIMTVFGVDAADITAIDNIIDGHNARFKRKDTTYFIETTSVDNRTAIIDDVTALGVVYIFFHDGNGDASDIWTSGISTEFDQDLRSVLL